MNKDCEKFNDALALGDDAPEDEIQFAEAHVRTCPECQAVARGFELFLEALTDEESEEEDPPEVQAAILEAARKQAEEFARRRRARARSPIVRRVLVAAGVTGAVAASFLLGQSTGGGDPVAIRLRYAEAEYAAQHFEHVQTALGEVLGDPTATPAQRKKADELLERLKKPPEKH
jgi:hypothetical protein